MKWKMIGQDVNVSLFPQYLYAEEAARNLFKTTNVSLPKMATYHHNRKTSVWVIKNSLVRAGYSFLKRILGDKNFYLRFKERYYTQGKRLINFSKKLNKIRLNNKNNKELYKYLTQYAKLWQGICLLSASLNSLELEKPILTEKIKNYLKRKTDHWEEVFDLSTSPEKYSIVKKEEFDLLKLAIQIKKNKNWSGLFTNRKTILKNLNKYPSLEKKVSKIHRRYCFTAYSYEGPAWDIDYYLQRLANLLKDEKDLNKKLEQFKKQKKLSNEKREELLLRLKIDPTRALLTKIAAELTYLRIYSKLEVSFQSRYYLEKLLGEIATRININLEQLRWLTLPEIKEALLKGKIDLEEIKKRSKNCLFIAEKDKNRIASGEEASRFARDNLKQRFIKSVRLIKGFPACKGKVKGRVKIINYPKENSKMNKGDILVAYVTNPNLMPAIRKAGAIITDRGGLTCHAAIIAREFKIPCIINTKIATEVLKDGDLVEVDADKGILKKL